MIVKVEGEEESLECEPQQYQPLLRIFLSHLHSVPDPPLPAILWSSNKLPHPSPEECPDKDKVE